MKIKQVEELVGSTSKNIRFYENQGLLTPERAENGYREYHEQNIEALKKIKLLRKLGISVEEIDGYLKENWVDIRDRIRKRKYKPQPVRRVEIPKPNGGVRSLGIPTVVDRIIEQAMAQVISPIAEKQFRSTATDSDRNEEHSRQ